MGITRLSVFTNGLVVVVNPGVQREAIHTAVEMQYE
jgi:hypothetical protein